MAVVVAAENTVQGEQTMVVAATTGDSAYRLVVTAAGTVETAGSAGAAVGTEVGVLAEVDVVDVINLVWL